MFISKSFKDRFFKTAFFRKADAKVRTIFELAKLFGKYFSESFYRQRFITLIPGHHVNVHPLSLSKAGAKLLLYNIQTKLYCTLFSSFFGTFPQEADSQTDYGLRKEVADRQKECRYTLYRYARAYKEKKRKELPHLQQQQTVKRGRKTLAWQTICNRKRMKDSHLQARCRCGRKFINALQVKPSALSQQDY